MPILPRNASLPPTSKCSPCRDMSSALRGCLGSRWVSEVNHLRMRLARMPTRPLSEADAVCERWENLTNIVVERACEGRDGESDGCPTDYIENSPRRAEHMK